LWGIFEKKIFNFFYREKINFDGNVDFGLLEVVKGCLERSVDDRWDIRKVKGVVDGL